MFDIVKKGLNALGNNVLEKSSNARMQRLGHKLINTAGHRYEFISGVVEVPDKIYQEYLRPRISPLGPENNKHGRDGIAHSLHYLKKTYESDLNDLEELREKSSSHQGRSELAALHAKRSTGVSYCFLARSIFNRCKAAVGDFARLRQELAELAIADKTQVTHDYAQTLAHHMAKDSELYVQLAAQYLALVDVHTRAEALSGTDAFAAALRAAYAHVTPLPQLIEIQYFGQTFYVSHEFLYTLHKYVHSEANPQIGIDSIARDTTYALAAIDDIRNKMHTAEANLVVLNEYNEPQGQQNALHDVQMFQIAAHNFADNTKYLDGTPIKLLSINHCETEDGQHIPLTDQEKLALHELAEKIGLVLKYKEQFTLASKRLKASHTKAVEQYNSHVKGLILGPPKDEN